MSLDVYTIDLTHRTRWVTKLGNRVEFKSLFWTSPLSEDERFLKMIGVSEPLQVSMSYLDFDRNTFAWREGKGWLTVRIPPGVVVAVIQHDRRNVAPYPGTTRHIKWKELLDAYRTNATQYTRAPGSGMDLKWGSF